MSESWDDAVGSNNQFIYEQLAHDASDDEAYAEQAYDPPDGWTGPTPIDDLGPEDQDAMLEWMVNGQPEQQEQSQPLTAEQQFRRLFER